MLQRGEHGDGTHYDAFAPGVTTGGALSGRRGCGYSVGGRKETHGCANSSRSLVTPSTPPWRRPSGTASSTNLAKPRASASTSSRSTPTNQSALITLLLALTDQFGDASDAHQRAREVLAVLESEYDKAYYAGIIAERRAKAQLAHGGAGSSVGAHDWIVEAMKHFERAEWLRPSGNDDARLRWNACARFLDRHPQLRPSAEERREIEMLE